MTSSKNTKRALLASVLSVVLCCAMLVGSTFAWFTDSVTSGGNQIVAGNLKADLIHVDDGKEVSIKGNPDHKIFDYDKWEPGYTVMETLKVVNNGNLAFKFRLDAVADGYITGPNGEKLADVIDVWVYEGEGIPATTSFAEMTEDAAWRNAGSLSALMADPDGIAHGVLLPENTTPANGEPVKEVQMTVVLHMQESAGNAYQGLTLGDLNFTLMAAQYTYEEDSFGSDYDEKAVYPDVAYAQASTQEELNSILNNPIDANGNPTKEVVVELGEGSYTLPAISGDKKVTISGGDNTVIDMTESGIISAQNTGLDLTIEGAKVEFANENYKGITHSKKVTYKDCVITGKQFLYAEEVEFINCKFVQDAADYNVWTYGAGTVLFQNCDFACQGKSVLIYNEGGTTQTVEFQNCKFNASAPADGKAAIEIDSYGTSYNVIIDQYTADHVTGFANGSVSGNPVWNVKNNVKPVTVTVGGTVVYNQ